MPSKLTGLFKTLRWSDFVGTPDAGSHHLAFTSTSFSIPNILLSSLVNDNINVTVTFNASKSWKKMDEINQKKKRTPDQILKHEQGHYDIVALLARDLFIDLMQLKGNTYKNQAELNKDVRPILAKYNGVEKKLMDKYDLPTESDHGESATGQDKWNRMIKEAFTTPRSPAVFAPDGKAYKIPLLDVLAKHGIKP
nr:DUF922 domain-containing protein [Rhodopirellula sp. SM50]